MKLEWALARAEEALAGLSNAIYGAMQESIGYRGNLEWADAAVDRALGDLAKIRQWLEAPPRRKGD